MKLVLAFGFFVTAAIYASVGFGGGSTYTALLAVSGTSYILIPIISLLCNIAVVSGNSWRYWRGGFFTRSHNWPLIILSVPAAFIGGMVNVSEIVFIFLLSVALLIAGLRMLLSGPVSGTMDVRASERRKGLGALIGGCIGFYSGIVGIGGGIFLAPILYRLRWGQAQNIAASCSFFILVNSGAGLIGQLIKSAGRTFHADMMSYWPLILAVLIGGTLGNKLSLSFFKPKHLRRLTAILILGVAIRLIIKWVAMLSWI